MLLRAQLDLLDFGLFCGRWFLLAPGKPDEPSQVSFSAARENHGAGGSKFSAGAADPLQVLQNNQLGNSAGRFSQNVQISQKAVTLVVAAFRERVRIDSELKMIFNFIFRRRRRQRQQRASALADLHVGESAILSELELSPPVAEHLMNLGFVPGLEVKVLRSGPGGDPRVYRVDGTEVAMRRDLSRHIHVELIGAPAFGD
jgi:ferrous iron transport protein A